MHALGVLGFVCGWMGVDGGMGGWGGEWVSVGECGCVNECVLVDG